MHQSNLRITKHPQGWLSEIKVPYWTIFGIRYKWTHFISYSGIPEKPFYFSDHFRALEATLLRVENQLIRKQW